LKTELVSNVSHELKTPLALIRMFGETLESGIVADEQRRHEFYSIIRRESERLTHLINNVLDVARIDAGTKQYALARCDVVQLVREALDAYRPLFDRLGFQVDATLPESPVYLLIDREAIAQALVNLFQNAIKYSGEMKVAAVSVGLRDGTVRLSVADRGVGIPREEIPRIFEKYYRVRRTARQARPGAASVYRS
jgi:signal transduction histidine kinase